MIDKIMWDILDEIRTDAKNLLVRVSVVETNLENHLKHQEAKFTKTTVIISIIIAAVGLVAIFK